MHWQLEYDLCWSYYIYLDEGKVQDFARLWLEDKVMKWKPEAKGRITHEYYVEPFNSIDLHGGITFYQKHGHTEGFRTVEIGCDYQHHWDRDREAGYPATLKSVVADAEASIDSCIKVLQLAVPSTAE